MQIKLILPIAIAENRGLAIANVNAAATQIAIAGVFVNAMAIAFAD